MRICIYGAGAGGGHFAVRLAQAGHEVCVVARGPNLEAIRSKGLTLRSGGDAATAALAASDSPVELGAQDLVIVAVKATGLRGLAPALRPLVGRDTLLVFPQNGMPWWYPIGLRPEAPRPPDLPLFRLAGEFLSAVDQEHVLGGVIYSANEMAEPGVVVNNSPEYNGVDLGAITAGGEAGAAQVREVLQGAGIAAPPVADLRASVWKKLLYNMSGSVIALVTRSKASAAREDPALGEIYRRVVREGLAIAAAHRYPLDDKIDPEVMLSRLIDHKPSLLQDYERGRMMEVAEIVQAPVAFARAAGVAAPTLETLAAIATRLAVDRGLVRQ